MLELEGQANEGLRWGHTRHDVLQLTVEAVM